MTEFLQEACRELEVYAQEMDARDIEWQISTKKDKELSVNELKEEIEARGAFVGCLDVDSNLRRIETRQWIICVREMGDYCILFSYRNPGSFSVSVEEKADMRRVAENPRFPHDADAKGSALHKLLEYGYFHLRREALTLLFRKHLWWRMNWID